jgi:hypothetical protein
MPTRASHGISVFGQGAQDLFQHRRVIDHLHVRRDREVPVVGAGKRRAAGGKDDVVAMTPEADETAPEVGGFPGSKAGQPVAAETHLTNVDATPVRAEACPGVR